MAASSERILLLQLKRIGDFILTAPAVAALRDAKPHAEIVAVAPSEVAGIARCIRGISRVLPYRSRALNLRTWAAILAGSWDACIDFAGTDRTALMTRLSRATRRIGFRKFADSSSKALAYTGLCDASVRDLHTVDFHLALTREIGAARETTPHPILALPKAESDSVAAQLASLGVSGSYAVIHPGTARAEKLWVPERWAAVAAHLSEVEGLPVVLTGSADGIELPHLARMKQALTAPVIDLTGKLTLIQTAAVIAGAAIVVGVDSMAMHLAALFERPQVVLFGPTNPFHWRPRHERSVVIQAGRAEPLTRFEPQAEGGEMDLISTEQIINAMRSLRHRFAG